jgi:hypothetical protein
MTPADRIHSSTNWAFIFFPGPRLETTRAKYVTALCQKRSFDRHPAYRANPWRGFANLVLEKSELFNPVDTAYMSKRSITPLHASDSYLLMASASHLLTMPCSCASLMGVGGSGGSSRSCNLSVSLSFSSLAFTSL